MSEFRFEKIKGNKSLKCKILQLVCVSTGVVFFFLRFAHTVRASVVATGQAFVIQREIHLDPVQTSFRGTHGDVLARMFDVALQKCSSHGTMWR